MKSSIVYAGVPDQVKALLFDILEISEGVLPVKYSPRRLNDKEPSLPYYDSHLEIKPVKINYYCTRLRAQDSDVLAEKILKRVQSWTSKLLSYGRRAQLINAHSILLEFSVCVASEKVKLKLLFNPSSGLGLK